MPLVNIEKFFLIPKTVNCGGPPLSNRRRKLEPVKEFFIRQMTDNKDMSAITITIGNKYYGGMDCKTQYKHMVKAIKECLRSVKFLACFEQQQNGNLHAHIISEHIYSTRATTYFGKFGPRNYHEKSCEAVKRTDYVKYITKECHETKYQWISNVNKNDMI